ncbi:hypothetical protein RE6C_02371 [Rhodopirellula europaea 6C]|uniref:Uncharacterized protein n=1 Tax=Rhodopirellula europaea 6C TaxID=1263867 RepID=M2AW04_9BACT|nr:hypothetical protein RE6C_02371 [Rhodopirellula europaea 6C]
MGVAKKVARRREEHVGLGSREHTAIDRNRAVWMGEVDALIDDSQTIVPVKRSFAGSGELSVRAPNFVDAGWRAPAGYGWGVEGGRWWSSG